MDRTLNFIANNIPNKDFTDYLINFLTSFFGTPALLIGLFALIGSLIQRKKGSEVILSVFKTIIGFLIIGGGATLVSGSIDLFGKAFVLLFNRDGFVANNDVMPGLFLDEQRIQWIATAGSLILILSMCLNLLLAKISKLKYVYLTGHSAWYFSVMVASAIAIADPLFSANDMWLIVIAGSLFTSMWMVITPAILNKHMNIITKDNKIALAHSGTITYALGGYIGQAVHKFKKGNVRSTEDVKFPKGLNFLRNTNVSIALTMVVLFLFIYFLAWGIRGDQAMLDAGIVKSSDSIFVQGLIQAFTFAAGVEVLLIGVRMFLAEIIPAFKGISDKFIRDAKPGIDCPVVFPFAPNAVIMGFIASVIGGVITFGINIGVSVAIGNGVSAAKSATWAAIIIPSIIPHFFTGATSGVFGNAKGGVLGAWLAGLVNGIIISLVPWIIIGVGMIQPEITAKYVVWGDADFILGLIPWIIVKYLGGRYALLGIMLLLWLLIPAISVIIHQYKMAKNNNYKNSYLEVENLRRDFNIKNKNEKQNLKANLQKLEKNKDNKQAIKEEIVKLKKEFEANYKKMNRELEKQVKEIRMSYGQNK